MFKTKCPHCGANDQLYVLSGVFMSLGMKLTKYGFAFSDAKQVDTEDEVVECNACKKSFSLTEVTK